uniref:C3H1-type domain-containing protein n=1 Tax=Glossina austeni TaxID=7395 RepID=A0A1A9UGX0_GLOAU
MAAMVNMSNLLSGKDSRWLQLEVCREFQRNKCSRQDTECKFAHPPANVEVQNGKVTACYDSIKRIPCAGRERKFQETPQTVVGPREYLVGQDDFDFNAGILTAENMVQHNNLGYRTAYTAWPLCARCFSHSSHWIK